MSDTRVNYVDTWSILAHYDFNHCRIEISSFLKQFPELHDFCVEHETKHAEIHKRHKFSWEHYVLDIKDRFRLHNSKVLSTQLRTFRKEMNPKHIHVFVFMLFYSFITAITFPMFLIEIRHIIPKNRILKAFQRGNQ